MKSALGCLFILLISIFALIAIAAARIVRVLLNFGRPTTRPSSRRPDKETHRSADNTSAAPKKGRSGKIFGKNEGRYVDFEEV